MVMKNQELKKAGLKVTLPRIKILHMFGPDGGHHLSAEDIYRALQQSGEEVGLATVYRVLTQFESAGLIRKHNFDGTHAIYELETEEHHDHMVDVVSGEVIEFADDVIEQRLTQIAKDHNMHIVDRSLVIYVNAKA